jgi:hypothetical protein
MPVTAAQTRPAPAARPSKLLRSARWITAVAALAAFGGAVYYGNRARTLGQQASHAPAFDAALDARGRSAERRQWWLLGLGTTALTATAGLFLLPASREPLAPSAAVSLAPSWSGSGPGLAGSVFLSWRLR